MTIVDWVLIGAVLAFAWAGWRQGFVVGLLSFAGFLGGGLAAAYFLPDVIAGYVSEGLPRSLVIIGAILISALVGQVLASMLGRVIRAAITWSPVMVVDKALGAALNVLAFAMIVWIIATAMAMLPTSQVSTLVQQSKVVTTLDLLVPNQMRDAFIRLRDAVGEGALPRVFSTITEVVGPEVAEPDAGLIDDPGVQAAAQSVPRIVGSAAACRLTLSGTGFFVADDVVLTNAHVVAGVQEPEVQLGDLRLPATVVYFDPRLDVAALRLVPGVRQPLTLQVQPPSSGDGAAIVGYPGGRALQVLPVRVRALIDARGDDIYGRSGVSRQVISFRGSVEHGDSGGPLLAAGGRVLGMVFGSGISSETTGYAIAAAELEPAIAAAQSASRAVSTGTCTVRD